MCPQNYQLFQPGVGAEPRDSSAQQTWRRPRGYLHTKPRNSHAQQAWQRLAQSVQVGAFVSNSMTTGLQQD